jgi:hypothetical protein
MCLRVSYKKKIRKIFFCIKGVSRIYVIFSDLKNTISLIVKCIFLWAPIKRRDLNVEMRSMSVDMPWIFITRYCVLLL